MYRSGGAGIAVVEPDSVRAQQVGVADAPSITDAVEKFQDLHGAFASEAAGVAEGGRRDGAGRQDCGNDTGGSVSDISSSAIGSSGISRRRVRIHVRAGCR